MAIRSLICSVLGHVDHGKSSILDKIRGTAITAKEAGGITQAIGASIIPLDTIKKICGDLIKATNMKITIPGLLFVDTPGHAAFTSLRKRGGSIADIAILVIDINEGFKPQTEEAIEILRNSKTPFVIAANKVDLISGWQQKHKNIIQNIGSLNSEIFARIEQRLYEIVGRLSEKFSMNSERFDRVEDYTKEIAIVPCSAKTGDGIPELLMVITALAQRYLEQNLQFSEKGPAKGTIMEVKEEKGLGHTMDVILYDGTLKLGDTIVIGSLQEPIIAKVRALFEPMPLEEMRDKKSKFKPVKEAEAATGVKISAPGAEEAMSGMPIISVIDKNDLEKTKRLVQQEIENVVMETEGEGIVIKADNLGSLEAMINILKGKKMQIRRASLGEITKQDIADAESNYETDPLMSVILAFNIVPSDETISMSGKVHIISNEVIYRLIEEYEKWKETQSRALEEKKLEDVTRPCKIQLMKGYVFRQSNPAVVGCEILMGKAKAGISLMNMEGKVLTEIKQIQLEQENIAEAERGKQVAVSMAGVAIGRQIKEGDILYSAVPEEDYKRLKELKKYLKNDEKELLNDIAKIMRKNNPVWGI